MLAPPVAVVELGCVPYFDAAALQARLVAARQAARSGDVLLLLEHPRVVTFGRNAHGENLRVDAAQAAALGVDLAVCDRGGDLTYHGPGQLVGYPILDLRRTSRPAFLPPASGRLELGPVDYMRALEEVLIRAAARFGVAAHRVAGRAGVWTGEGAREAKLAAMGVHIARGVTSHGFALNVSTDLELFARLIVPCGIADRGVTSLARELARPVSAAAVRTAVVREFGRVFARRMHRVSPASLDFVPPPQPPATSLHA